MAHKYDEIRTGAAPHWQPEDIIGKMTLKTLMFSDDYRHIAPKGVLTSLVMLAIAGIFAMIFRTERMVPDVQFLGARVYMTLMTLHGIVHGVRLSDPAGDICRLLPDAQGAGTGPDNLGQSGAVELLDPDGGSGAADHRAARFHLDGLRADVAAGGR